MDAKDMNGPGLNPGSRRQTSRSRTWGTSKSDKSVSGCKIPAFSLNFWQSHGFPPLILASVITNSMSISQLMQYVENRRFFFACKVATLRIWIECPSPVLDTKFLSGMA